MTHLTTNSAIGSISFWYNDFFIIDVQFFEPMKSNKNAPVARRTRKSSSESTSSTSQPLRRSRRISTDSDTKLATKTKSSRRSLFDDLTIEPKSKPPTKMAPRSKLAKQKSADIDETPTKPLARLLDSNLTIQTPKSKSTRRKTTALTSISETPKTPKKKPKPDTEMTPATKLAGALENLAVRRSTRRSAVQATANIIEQQYKPPSSSESESDGSSGEQTSESDDDRDAEIMKTPKKRARPWRGAKTPSKKVPKTPK